MTIALIGMMGSGKSTVGKILADSLGCTFTDLDAVIEKTAGMSIPEIFSTKGESAFREMELAELKKFIKKDNEGSFRVLSCGGGTPAIPEAAHLLREKTVCIYLEVTPEEAASRLIGNASDEGGTGGVTARPLLEGADKESLEERLSNLLSEREQAYLSAASVTLPCTGLTAGETADEIIFTCL